MLILKTSLTKVNSLVLSISQALPVHTAASLVFEYSGSNSRLYGRRRLQAERRLISHYLNNLRKDRKNIFSPFSARHKYYSPLMRFKPSVAEASSGDRSKTFWNKTLALRTLPSWRLVQANISKPSYPKG